METDSPIAIMLAGPNGAGKTTTADTLFRQVFPEVAYVNADIIAQGLARPDSPDIAMRAGRMMLERLHELAAHQENFAFETTGASRSFAARLRVLKKSGYRVAVFYFWLPTADVAVARVAERVRRGGHNVPEDTIRRRFELGLRNFFRLYRPLADYWEFNDNSGTQSLPIADSDWNAKLTVSDAILWRQLEAQYLPKDHQ